MSRCTLNKMGVAAEEVGVSPGRNTKKKKSETVEWEFYRHTVCENSALAVRVTGRLKVTRFCFREVVGMSDA